VDSKTVILSILAGNYGLEGLNLIQQRLDGSMMRSWRKPDNGFF
jgi:hypothetical protein